jgi:hypothetical protein
MSRRNDPDPAPRGWVVVDPHSTYWSALEDDEHVDPDHIPTPTYVTTKTITYTLGRHTVETTKTIYTNRKPKPEEAQS